MSIINRGGTNISKRDFCNHMFQHCAITSWVCNILFWQLNLKETWTWSNQLIATWSGSRECASSLFRGLKLYICMHQSLFHRAATTCCTRTELFTWAINKGGTQSWTGDLLICSQTLYHWAIPPHAMWKSSVEGWISPTDQKKSELQRHRHRVK